jgi:hypothetical protein
MNTKIMKFSLNESELNEAFLTTIRPLILGKDITLSISEADGQEFSLHTSFKSESIGNNPVAEIEKDKPAQDKGTPGSKGAGGRQPPKITIEFA